MATSSTALMILCQPSPTIHEEKHGHLHVALGKLSVRARSASAMPSQRGDAARAERLKELNNLLEDVAKTAVSTGPRGVVRLAQGVEAVVTVGGEYLFQLLTVPLLATRVLIWMWAAESGSRSCSEKPSIESPWASRVEKIV